MQLDYVERTGYFTLRVKRGEADLRSLMHDHGLDFSAPASTGHEAVLMTNEPYAAASFAAHATPLALSKLKGILDQVEASWKTDSTTKIAVPADKELWPFQKANVEYALGRRNTLIADEPGLGKTPTAIAFANQIKAKRVLVVCPASIRLQWATRIREWSTMTWPYTVHVILNGNRGVNPTAEWTVVSYELCRSPATGAALAAGQYDLLILDEAHYLKTTGTKRSQAILGGGLHRAFPAIESRCGAILALTGTPLPNRPREAYTLARALCWDAIDWQSEDDFQERFNPVARGETDDGRVYVREEVGRAHELQMRLRGNFMTRHLKRDVMPQLKLPIYDLIEVENTTAVRKALEAESLLGIDPEDLTGADMSILGHVSEVRKQMGIALAPQVAQYVNMLIEGGETKIVLFAWHIEVLNILERALAKHGVLRIDGSTSMGQRKRLVDQFQSDPSKEVMLGNVLSLGTGVDGLQNVSCHALIAEPSWTPGENVQCFDRLDRGNQARQVQCDMFVAPNSIAARILASALRKLQTTNKALDKRV
jgi:SWI/SNF-related matrix-associated actin-dependent regulator 1 of chromatin subfamily A